MSTYLVTGISSALGSRLAALLAADPKTTKILGVDEVPLAASLPKLEFAATPLAQADWEQLLQGIDRVVHLDRYADSHDVDRLLRVAAAAGVDHVTIASSTTVFGAWPTNPVPMSEDSPLRPNSLFDYAVNLAEVERVAGDIVSDADFDLAIVRLAIVVGPGSDERHLTETVGGVHAHREFNMARPVQFLHVDDAVSALELATTRALDGIFNAAPETFLSDSTAREIAGTAPRPGLPRRIAWMANDAVFRRKFRTDFAAAEPYLRHPWVVSSGRLRSHGWICSYTSEEALLSDASPTWWAGLRPGQRRAIVTLGIAGIASTSFLLPAATFGYFARRNASRVRLPENVKQLAVRLGP